MPERLTRRHTSSEMQWVVAGILLVCLIWFNSGFFGVHPSLLSGVSMEPTFVAGDVVIVRKVAPSTIKVDDVVEFRQGNSEIIHRVNEIRKDANGKLIFITQGDNNNVLDSPWDETQLRGKAIGYIPKVGWVGILVKNLVNAARAK
jgi:signal peptidase